MAISFECTGCGRAYNVKDDLAGRRIRCKSCEAVLTVPQDAEGEEDWLEGDMDDWNSPPQALPKKKSSTSKKKKGSRKKAASNLAPRIGAILGGVFTFLVVAGFVARLVVNLANRPDMRARQVNVEWQDYTTPDGAFSVQMPGFTKLNPRAMVVPGGSSYVAETPQFACGISIEPVPFQARGASPDEILDALRTGLPMEGASNVSDGQIAGNRAIRFDMSRNGVNSQNQATVNGNTLYTFSYAYRRSLDAATSEKFFGSIRFNQ